MPPSHTPKPTPRPAPEPVDLTSKPRPIQPIPLTNLDARAVLVQLLVALFRWDGAKGMCSNVVCDVIRVLCSHGFLKSQEHEQFTKINTTNVGDALVRDHAPMPLTGRERQLGDISLLRQRYAGFYTPFLQSAAEERTALLALETATRTAMRPAPVDFLAPENPPPADREVVNLKTEDGPVTFDLPRVPRAKKTEADGLDAIRKAAKAYTLGPWQGSNGGTFRIAERPPLGSESDPFAVNISYPLVVIETLSDDGHDRYRADLKFEAARWTSLRHTTRLEARLDADAKLREWGFALPEDAPARTSGPPPIEQQEPQWLHLDTDKGSVVVHLPPGTKIRSLPPSRSAPRPRPLPNRPPCLRCNGTYYDPIDPNTPCLACMYGCKETRAAFRSPPDPAVDKPAPAAPADKPAPAPSAPEQTETPGDVILREFVPVFPELEPAWKVCSRCDGSGDDIDDPNLSCPACNGEGAIDPNPAPNTTEPALSTTIPHPAHEVAAPHQRDTRGFPGEIQATPTPELVPADWEPSAPEPAEPAQVRPDTTLDALGANGLFEDTAVMTRLDEQRFWDRCVASALSHASVSGIPDLEVEDVARDAVKLADAMLIIRRKRWSGSGAKEPTP